MYKCNSYNYNLGFSQVNTKMFGSKIAKHKTEITQQTPAKLKIVITNVT